MKLMMEVRGFGDSGVLDQQLFKSRMRKRGRQTSRIQVEQDDHRMRRDNVVNKDRRNVEDMFNRVHGHARPRTNSRIAMMQSVVAVIQRRPMQKQVNEIEMCRQQSGQNQ